MTDTRAMAFQAELYGKRRRGGRGWGKQRMVLQQGRKCMRMRLVDKLIAIPSIFRFPEFQTIAVDLLSTKRMSAPLSLTRLMIN
jgi:hypothetical protein